MSEINRLNSDSTSGESGNHRARFFQYPRQYSLCAAPARPARVSSDTAATVDLDSPALVVGRGRVSSGATPSG
jgi:hypothetical protein